MFKKIRVLFWSFFDWELMEETFDQTRSGMIYPDYYGKAKIFMWRKLWDEEAKRIFLQAAQDIEIAGFIAHSRRHNVLHYRTNNSIMKESS